MRNKLRIIIVLFITFIVVCLSLQIYEKAKYDEMLSWIRNPIFYIHPMDEAEHQFIDNVKASWNIVGQTNTNKDFEGFLKRVGHDGTVKTFVYVGSSELPGFSFFNLGRNKRVVDIVNNLDLLVDETADNTIYYKDGLVYLRMKSKGSSAIIQVYEDSDDGIKSTLYHVKLESGEPGAKLPPPTGTRFK